MSDLLEQAIAAHGGWTRWQQVTRLNVHAAIGGGLWGAKGKPGLLDDVRIAVDTQRQHVEYAPFGAAGRHSVYEPDRVAVETDDGQVLESRRDPRAAFAGHRRETPWDNLHLVYFSGYALWGYLNTPFLFRLPDFSSEEIEPWNEDGEEWRRLKVTFPPTIASHSREQVFYFGRDGLLRRQDYAVEVLGGLPGTHYFHEPKVFGGLVFPTKRRAYARGPDNRPVTERVTVAIDLHDIEVL